jgi:hypothetical protein
LPIFSSSRRPPWWYEETFHAYWSQEAVQARKRWSRIRWSVGLIAVLAVLVIVVVTYVLLARVVPSNALIIGIHAPFTAAAAVLLAVPRWRRWLLSQGWTAPLFILAGYGAFYIAAFWPDALGGWSVGGPLLIALFASLVVGLVLACISMWRSDRRSTIEMLVMAVVVTATAAAGDRYIGKDFGWLIAFLPMAAYFGYIFIFRRQRASN